MLHPPIGCLLDDKELYKLLYAFIYPLYDPGDFADKSYTRTKIDWIDGTVEYTVQIRIPSTHQTAPSVPWIVPNFRAISARNPFTTRTHVLSNASFKRKLMARLSLC
jgi:hypothetical protein